MVDIFVWTSGTSPVDFAVANQILAAPGIRVRGFFFDRQNAVVDKISSLAASANVPYICVPWSTCAPESVKSASGPEDKVYKSWSELFHQDYVAPALDDFGDADFALLARYKNVVYGLDMPLLNIHQAPPRLDGGVVEGRGFYKGFCSPKEPRVPAKRIVRRDYRGGAMTHVADPNVPLDEGQRCTFFEYQSKEAPWDLANHAGEEALVKLGMTDPLIAYLVRENESYLPAFAFETLRLFASGELRWKDSRTILYKGEKLEKPIDLSPTIARKLV